MSTLKKSTQKTKSKPPKPTPVKSRKKYQKILLKLSGEALAGDAGYGIEPHILEYIADEVQEIHKLGIEIAIVLGGGNIFRGIKGATSGMDRATADYMGMLATVLNSLALQDALERKNVHTRVQAAISMQELAEPYIRRRAVRHLEKNRVVIFAAGTGNPYFTTDTTAALRAMEVGSDVVLKATKVDGIYSADPFKDHKAVKYSELTYLDVLQKGLKVMDSTAISLCMDNNLPIIVFNLNQKGALKKVVQGHALGTFVR